VTNALTRRSLLGAAVAAPAAIAIAALPVSAADPNPDRPIPPAEYLAEMEANGWRPVTDRVGESCGGVYEYCLNNPPTREDMDFLRSHQSSRRQFRISGILQACGSLPV
jgi:hypothetical protein